MKQYGFDGVDCDWEYPEPKDKKNFTLLLAELRKHLDKWGKQDKRHYLLTIAAPTVPSRYQNVELDKIAKYLDWFNLMTYDFYGSWSKMTNFNSPLYPSTADPDRAQDRNATHNCDAAVQAYLQAGIPAHKLLLGLPLFGRGFAGVAKVNNGLYQLHNATPPRLQALAYKDIVATYLGTCKRYWHSQAKVPWLYDENSRIMISYDDPNSLRIKAHYVLDHGLGGVMFWELSQDDAKNTLVNTVYQVLHPQQYMQGGVFVITLKQLQAQAPPR
jgi:chitinase